MIRTVRINACVGRLGLWAGLIHTHEHLAMRIVLVGKVGRQVGRHGMYIVILMLLSSSERHPTKRFPCRATVEETTAASHPSLLWPECYFDSLLLLDSISQ